MGYLHNNKIVCTLSSLSISISFIGVFIHLISISILLDNYVIINSKSDSTCKEKKKTISYPQPFYPKTTFPSELANLLTIGIEV